MTSERPMDDRDESYYPMLIQYKDTDELIVVNQPTDVDRGRKFIVVRTSQRPGQKAS